MFRILLLVFVAFIDFNPFSTNSAVLFNRGFAALAASQDAGTFFCAPSVVPHHSSGNAW